MIRRLSLLAASLLAASACAAGPGAKLSLAGDMLYALPPEAAVRQALDALPHMRLGAMGNELAAAEQAKLEAGPHEWTVQAGAARRQVLGDGNYREQEYGLERGVRWFGKARQDRAIGAQGVHLAEAQRADAWHESCRSLMQDWYSALRAQATLQRLTEQQTLVQQLRAVAERRVKAGESPALDLMQADTELRRAEAQLGQARQDAAQALALLATGYQHLPEPQAGRLPEPQRAAEGEAERIARMTEDNHELELAQAAAELEGLKARRTASERMPDPTIAVRATRERAGHERTLGVTLSVPLPGQARNAEAAAASIRARMADERVRQVRNKVLFDARSTVLQEAQSYGIWSSLRSVAEQSARQAQLMERAYQAGESTLGEALQSRRQALDAALAAQLAQINALAASARVQLDLHALWPLE